MVGVLESSMRSRTGKVANVAHYKMEGTTGDVVDSVNGYNGSIIGTVNRGIVGQVGNCFDFVNGEVRVPNNAAFSLNDGTENKDLEFSFFISFDTISNVWLFNKRGAAGSTAEYQFVYNSAKLKLQIWNTDGTQWVWETNSSVSFATGKWYKISGATDIATGSINISRDDVLLTGTVTGSIKTFNTTTSDFVIGRAAWDSNFGALDGKMDELKISVK